MPSVYVEPVPEAQVDSSEVWLCKKDVQGLKISRHPEIFTAHRKSTTWAMTSWYQILRRT